MSALAHKTISPSELRRLAGRSMLETTDRQDDAQASALKQEQTAEIASRDLLLDLFGDHPLTRHATMLEQAVKLRLFIRKRRRDSILASLEIGQSLIEASAWMPSSAFDLFIADERNLGMSEASARKYMAVAKAVEDGFFMKSLFATKYPIEDLPPYSVTYELVSLPEDGLKAADAKKLICSDATQQDIVRLKNELRRARRAPGTMDLMRQKGRLMAKKSRLERELGKICVELDEISRKLTMASGALA